MLLAWQMRQGHHDGMCVMCGECGGGLMSGWSLNVLVVRFVYLLLGKWGKDVMPDVRHVYLLCGWCDGVIMCGWSRQCVGM